MRLDTGGTPVPRSLPFFSGLLVLQRYEAEEPAGSQSIGHGFSRGIETSYECAEGVLTPFGPVGFSHSVWWLKPNYEKGLSSRKVAG